MTGDQKMKNQTIKENKTPKPLLAGKITKKTPKSTTKQFSNFAPPGPCGYYFPAG